MAAYGGRSKWSLVSIFPIDTVGQLMLTPGGMCWVVLSQAMLRRRYPRLVCDSKLDAFCRTSGRTARCDDSRMLFFFTCRTVQVLFRVSCLGHCTILKCDFAMDFGTESAQIE